MRESNQTPVLNVGSRIEIGDKIRKVKSIRGEKVLDAIGNVIVQPVVILDSGERISGQEIEEALGI